MKKKRNVFISFDVDDKSMVNLIRHQAKDDRFPFKFKDYSVKEPFKKGWKGGVRNLMFLSSAVIVAIGKYTHKSKAVNWEIKEAHKQKKMVVGIRLHRDKKHKVPPEMGKGDKITYWDTAKIAQRLEG